MEKKVEVSPSENNFSYESDDKNSTSYEESTGNFDIEETMSRYLGLKPDYIAEYRKGIVNSVTEKIAPFKPYSNVGQFIEDTGLTIAASSGIFTVSMACGVISTALAGFSVIALAISPAIGTSFGLMTAGNTQREDEESIFSHILNSMKQGGQECGSLLLNVLWYAGVSLLVSAIAMSIAAVLIPVAAITAIVGTAIITSRGICTAGVGIKNAVQSGLSLFKGNTEENVKGNIEENASDEKENDELPVFEYY